MCLKAIILGWMSRPALSISAWSITMAALLTSVSSPPIRRRSCSIKVGGELDAALSGVRAASPPPRKQVVDEPEKPAINAEASEPQPEIDTNNGKAQPPRVGVPKPTDWLADLLKRFCFFSASHHREEFTNDSAFCVAVRTDAKS